MLLLLLSLLGSTIGGAAVTPSTMTWRIDGAERQAIVYAPAKATKSKVPVVFAFHGGGDTAEHFTIT